MFVLRIIGKLSGLSKFFHGLMMEMVGNSGN